MCNDAMTPAAHILRAPFFIWLWAQGDLEPPIQPLKFSKRRIRFGFQPFRYTNYSLVYFQKGLQMALFKTAALLAILAAQSASALTLEQTNVSDGGGVFVPAIIVTDGPSAGTYRIGDMGLTRAIIYNAANLRAWAARMAGVDLGSVTIYERDYSAPSDDDCAYQSSFDANLGTGNLIYVNDQPPINPCDPPCQQLGMVPKSQETLFLAQYAPCNPVAYHRNASLAQIGDQILR